MLEDETISFEQMKQIKGQVKAVALLTDKIYVYEKHGEDKLSLVEEEMKKMGFPFQYNSLKTISDFIPLNIRVASLFAIKNVFNLDNDQIREMGRLATKNSTFTKLVLRYLVSLKKMTKEIPRHWQRHYTVGSMDPGELREEEKYIIVRLRDFNVHPIFCTYLSGYILGDVELIGDFPNLRLKETQCIHRGNDCHEFKVTWE